MIPRETVEEVLSRNDIVSLISSYVSLQRAGSNLKGLCPFHSEKSPSFTVFPKDNSFFCFGCNIGGNAITFVREIEHLDYPDAVRFLGKRAGITVIDDGRERVSAGPRYDKAKFLRMNVDAAKYFHARLFDDNEKARAALSYFTEVRRLSMATVKHFGLGFAPDSFDQFTNYMLARGYTHDELVAGFLIGRSDKGRYYDAFRNRVMFPIIDVSGDVIGFGGRVMDDSKPKYKNTSDTPVFKKLRNLFALNFARLDCKDSLILCEGYMDVIALHAAGFANAVATLGTAINEEQARLMSRYTKRVIIAYDADEAGQRAAKRAMQMLSDVGLEVSVLKVPGAKDPDEFIKQFGPDKFRQVLDGSKSKFEYNMDNILGKYNIELAQDRINALQELIKMIATFPSSSERDIYIQAVSAKLAVNAQNIKTDVDRIIQSNFRKYKKDESRKLRQASQGYADKVNPDYAKSPALAKQEETLLGLLLLYPNHRKRAFTLSNLCEDDFFTDFNRRIFTHVHTCHQNGTDPNEALDEIFAPAEVGRITKMKLSRMNLSDNGDEVFDAAVESLRAAVARKSAKNPTNLDELSSFITSIRQQNTPEH